MLPTDALEYDLPRELIATHPVTPRDASRLMVLRRSAPARVEHARFGDLDSYLARGDVLIRNVTRVLPARFAGLRRHTQGRVSGLYLGARGPGRWDVMLRSNGRLRVGDVIEPGAGVSMRLVSREADAWLVEVTDPSGAVQAGDPAALLARFGWPPLPPYILSARRAREGREEDPEDASRYQTVYASPDRCASVAAPTAGLHFTAGLLDRLASCGVACADVVLHVGAGTFRPIEADVVEAHDLHMETGEVSKGVLDAVSVARSGGGRSVVVGTTSVRALESVPSPVPSACDPIPIATHLLIAPGFEFRYTDALITNFHLPRSSLLALVAAFLGGAAEEPRASVERLLGHYREAIKRGYRFYSYGDAMLILP